MSDQLCPHCGGELNLDVFYCRHCTRRARDYKLCPTCQEPLSASATNCPQCNSRVPTEQDRAAQEIHLEFRATRLGAFFTGTVTGIFLPPFISVSEGRIRVKKWSLFGLREHHQEIQVSRVASVRYTKGVFWGGILVETFGGSAEDISEKGLRQTDAREMAEKLKSALVDLME